MAIAATRKKRPPVNPAPATVTSLYGAADSWTRSPEEARTTGRGMPWLSRAIKSWEGIAAHSEREVRLAGVDYLVCTACLSADKWAVIRFSDIEEDWIIEDAIMMTSTGEVATFSSELKARAAAVLYEKDQDYSSKPLQWWPIYPRTDND